ncbi:MAG: formate dehydrogenase accessory sulfurtransferase FdhD [Bacillota bacterium]|nr:formate dehydrogenase accessory sulfurtransferase FdhD [Bacillota bacterium]
MDDPIVACRVRRVDENGWRDQEDLIAREIALTVYLNSKELATLVCSPMDLKYMAVGFLCAEGILQKRGDLRGINLDEAEGLAWVETSEAASLAERVFLKRYITPCCGRSRTSFYFAADALLCKPVTSDLKVSTATALRLAAELQENSRLFHQTGGVHNAALAHRDRILIYREDIGRHNTLDKIYGQCFLEEISPHDKIIVFSGRVSSEILLKVAKMGVPVLVSRSAPTDLALKLAEDLRITVIGFARGNRLNIYTHPDRVIL